MTAHTESDLTRYAFALAAASQGRSRAQRRFDLQ